MLEQNDITTRQTAEVKGAVIALLRKEDEKLNLLIRFLREQKILTDEQWKQLLVLQVFPALETE